MSEINPEDKDPNFNLRIITKISDETGIPLEKILKKRVSDNEKMAMRAKVVAIENTKMVIDDTASLSIFEFRAKARRLMKTMGIKWIIVDYLQLMDGDKNSKASNRDNEIGKISRGLKKVAKELNIPVLALSQLSRAVEARAGAHKRPMLSDLRESGNIEQDADMVMFLHRPEYYGIMQNAFGRSTVGLCEIIIAKHRNGVTDTVNTDFNGSIMRFKDWHSDDSPAKAIMPSTMAMDFPVPEPEIDEDMPF